MGNANAFVNLDVMTAPPSELLREIFARLDKLDPPPDDRVIALALRVNPAQIHRWRQGVKRLNEESRLAIAEAIEGSSDSPALRHALEEMRATVEDLEAAVRVRQALAGRVERVTPRRAADDPHAGLADAIATEPTAGRERPRTRRRKGE
jgi:DNA-binding transcriptional regulator YdaS (Cro superfamily)